MKPTHLLVGTLATLLLSLGSSAYALDKADPGSRSGQGAARDTYLIKNTEEVAKCGGPVSTQSNPTTGAVTMVCRVNGVVREIVVKAPKKGGTK